MSSHDHSGARPPSSGSLWTSRAGIVLIGFLAVAGLLLAYEHRVHVFAGTGLLIALLVLCVGMHLFMHSGHGGHGGRGDGDENGDRRGGP